MRTFATLFGTGFALLLLAATVQAGSGKAVTPPSASLAAGLSAALSYLLTRFYDCITEVSKGHTPPGSRPGDPNDCRPEWLDSFNGLVGKARPLRSPI